MSATGAGSDKSAERLARAVRTRLAELRVSARSVSTAGFMPSATIGRLLSGVSLPRDLSGLERGLGWASGSAYQVAGGGEPTVVLVLRGQSARAGQGVIDWPPGPGEERDWRNAVEAAWEQVEKGGAAPDIAEEAWDWGGEAGWLAARTAELPAWLAERVRAVLADWEHHHPAGAPPDLGVLADRIMALDHTGDVVRLLGEWKDRLRAAPQQGDNDRARRTSHDRP